MQRESRAGEASFTPYSSATSQQGYCNICYNRYDQGECKPLLVCAQDHSICKACLKVILRAPRCPFCRAHIDLHRIRVNQRALQRVQGKPTVRKTFIQTVQKERFITEQTGNDGGEQLVDPGELVERQAAVRRGRGGLLTLKVMLLIELFLLQLPFGIYSLVAITGSGGDVCFDRPIGLMDLNLSALLFSAGYMESLIATLSIYFILMHYTILLNQGLFCSYFLLTFLAVFKALLCEVACIEMLQEDYLASCDGEIQRYVIAWATGNLVSFFLGIFILVFAFVKELCLGGEEEWNNGNML